MAAMASGTQVLRSAEGVVRPAALVGIAGKGEATFSIDADKDFTSLLVYYRWNAPPAGLDTGIR